MVSKKNGLVLQSRHYIELSLHSHCQAIPPSHTMSYAIWLRDHKYLSIANTRKSHENQAKRQQREIEDVYFSL